MQILQKHSETCMGNDLASRKAAWLGIARRSAACYDIRDENISSPLTYGNWKKVACPPDSDCIFVERDGLWSTNARATCNVMKLCTVCVIVGSPVFTLTGLCTNSKADWNYYLMVDSSNQIKHYEGYITTNIVRRSKAWEFVAKKGQG